MHQDDRPTKRVSYCGNRVRCSVSSADWPPCFPHHGFSGCGYYRYDSFLQQDCSCRTHFHSLQVTSFFSRPKPVCCFHDGHDPSFPHTNNPAGAQYVGVHFAALGVYTGNALLLRFIFSILSSIVYSRSAWTRKLAGREYLWPNQACRGRSSADYCR